MCLAKPLKLIEINSDFTGKVEIDGGNLLVGLDLVPEALIGDYVLVHAGMAIELLEKEDVQAILDAFEKYVDSEEQVVLKEKY